MTSDYLTYVAQFAGVGHTPVMLREVLQALQPAPQHNIIDMTFGRGGYSRALLAAGACVTAFDCDSDALPAAQALTQQYGAQFIFVAQRFDTAAAHVPPRHWHSIVFDLGLSTPQLTQSGRGFSFMRDEPLDMRADPLQPQTAADILNTYSKEDLADIFYQYGDEPRARHYANVIVAARPWHSALQLANAIEKAAGGRGGKRTHPATQLFQALRIAVNNEYTRLKTALAAVPQLLQPQGMLAVVSFHSGEDRIVKHTFAPAQGQSRYMPTPTAAPSIWRTQSAQRAAADEVSANPPSRSAVLRVAQYIGE